MIYRFEGYVVELRRRTTSAARSVALESDNHILLADEPAWSRFLTEVEAFLGATPA
jgi:hypothetical protein